MSNPYPGIGERVKFRLRVDMDAPVKEVYVRYSPDGEKQITRMEMEATIAPSKWWAVELPIGQTVFHYRFILVAADGVWFYNANGINLHDPIDGFDFKLLADYTPVEWLSEAVFYQIFPDRFENGDPSLDPKREQFEFIGYHPQVYPWESIPPEDQFDSLAFYGGDLPGIIQRLDYLNELGINTLYLNPVFTAPTNHKYDVVDYDHVDPHFGGNEALVSLRNALDAYGMRYILDIVPNHVGYWHPWFQKARQDITSPEADFFTFQQHPDQYESWLGVWLLPKLNYQSDLLRKRIYAGEQSAFRRWLRPPYSADGWRVDVANMLARQGPVHLAEEVNRSIRQAVKETRAEAYLMGENFHDATDQLQGDQFDGVMNYMGFLYPMLDWLRGYKQGAARMDGQITSQIPWPTAALEAAWRERRSVIPWSISLQQYNLLGSHDIPRILTQLDGSMALNRLAVTLLFTYPGVPGVYYGDEIGLHDMPVLNSRSCMVWDQARWDIELREFYRDLISFRKQSRALQSGGFQVLYLDEDILAFQRETGQERVLVAANRSTDRQTRSIPVRIGGVPDGANFVEHQGMETSVVNGQLTVELQKQSASIWQQEIK